MIHVWWLLMFWSVGYAGAADKVPFATREECIQAQADIKSQAGSGVDYACVYGVK